VPAAPREKVRVQHVLHHRPPQPSRAATCRLVPERIKLQDREGLDVEAQDTAEREAGQAHGEPELPVPTQAGRVQCEEWVPVRCWCRGGICQTRRTR
jgi:hypothetical protein